MRPRERMLCALRGEAADRVPISLPGLEYASRADVERVDDPLRRRIAERVFAETVFKRQIPSKINRFLVTPPQRMRTEKKELPGGNVETTGVIDTPDGELTFVQQWDPASRTTWTVKYPVEDAKDIERISSVPWELPEGLLPPSLDDVPGDFPDRGIASIHISSPFVCAAGMMRYEKFLELCADDLGLAKRLAEISRRRILECLEVLFSGPGIEYVWMGGSEWVTPPMGSPAIYDALVQEQERSIIEYAHEKAGAVVHIHCHGHVRHALARMIERGGDYTEPVEPPPDGDVTMAEAKEIAAGRITLGGNIEARILCNETEAFVEAATRAAFEGGRERFILCTTAGPSPRLSEREFRNYMRMIDVWEELSPIG